MTLASKAWLVFCNETESWILIIKAYLKIRLGKRSCIMCRAVRALGVILVFFSFSPWIVLCPRL